MPCVSLVGVAIPVVNRRFLSTETLEMRQGMWILSHGTQGGPWPVLHKHMLPAANLFQPKYMHCVYRSPHLIMPPALSSQALSGCRHDTASRRLFRRSTEEAASDPQGFVAAGGVKTLFVWGHREWKKGNTHQVRRTPTDH